MKVDLTQPMTTIDGTLITDNGKTIEAGGSPMPAKTLCARALVCDLETDKGKPELKVSRFRMAEKIMACQGSIDLDISEIETIEKRLDEGGFATTVYCRIKNIFDNARRKASDSKK